MKRFKDFYLKAKQNLALTVFFVPHSLDLVEGCVVQRRPLCERVFHLVFFDEQVGSAVGTIYYVIGSGNCLLTSIPL